MVWLQIVCRRRCRQQWHTGDKLGSPWCERINRNGPRNLTLGTLRKVHVSCPFEISPISRKALNMQREINASYCCCDGNAATFLHSYTYLMANALQSPRASICDFRIAAPKFPLQTSARGLRRGSEDRSSLNPTPLTHKVMLRSLTSGYLSAYSISAAIAKLNCPLCFKFQCCLSFEGLHFI